MSSLWQAPGSSPQHLAQLAAVVSVFLSPFLLLLVKRLYRAGLDTRSSCVDSESADSCSSSRKAVAQAQVPGLKDEEEAPRRDPLDAPGENEEDDSATTQEASAGEKEGCRQGSGQGGDQQRPSSEGTSRRQVVLCDKSTQLPAPVRRCRGEQIRRLLHAVSTGSLTSAGTLASKRQLFFHNLVGSCLSKNCDHHEARPKGQTIPDPYRQPSLRPSGQSCKRRTHPSAADSDTQTVRKHSSNLKHVSGHREVSSSLRDSSPLAFGDNIGVSQQHIAQHQCQPRRQQHLSAVLEKTGHSDTSLRVPCGCLKSTVRSHSDFIQPLGFKPQPSATLPKPKPEKKGRFFPGTVRHNWVEEKARDCKRTAAMDMSIHLTTNSSQPMPAFDDREAVNLSGQAKTNSAPQICVNIENACADLTKNKLTSIAERINALCATVQKQCSRQHSRLDLALFVPEEPVYPFPFLNKRLADAAQKMLKMDTISDIKTENMSANVKEEMITPSLDGCVLCRLNSMIFDSELANRQLNRTCCLCSIKREVLSPSSLYQTVVMSSSDKDLKSSLLNKDEISERRLSCPGYTRYTSNPENGTEKRFSSIQQQIPKVNPASHSIDEPQPCKCFNANTGLAIDRKEDFVLGIKRAVESDLYAQLQYLKDLQLKRKMREASGLTTIGAGKNTHQNANQTVHQNHQNAHANVFQRSYNGGSVNKNLLSLNTDGDARTNSAADIRAAHAPERRAPQSAVLEQNRPLDTDGDARQNSSLSVQLAEDASKTENRIEVAGPRCSLDTDGDARQSSTTSVLPLNRRSQPPEGDEVVEKPASSSPPLNTDEDVRQGSRTNILKPAQENGSTSVDRTTISMSLKRAADTGSEDREKKCAAQPLSDDDDDAEPARVKLAPAPEDSQNASTWTQDSSEDTSTEDTSSEESDSEVSSKAKSHSAGNKRLRATSATAGVTSQGKTINPKKAASTCSSCNDTFSTANCSVSTASLTASSGRASPVAVGHQSGCGEADKAPAGLRPKNKPRKSHQTESKEQQKCTRCQTPNRLLQRASPTYKFVSDTAPPLFPSGRPREQTCFAGGLSTRAAEDSSGLPNADSQLSEDDIRGTLDLTDWVSSTLRSWLPDFNNSQKNKPKSNMSSKNRHEEGSQTEFSFYDVRNLLENETLNKWSGQWTSSSNSCPHSCASSLCNFRRTLESWKQQLLAMHAALDTSSTSPSSCALCKDSVPHEQGAHNCHTMHLAQDFWRTVLQFKRSHLQDSKCPFLNYSNRLFDPQSGLLSGDIEFDESCVQRCSLGHEHCCSGDFFGCLQQEYNPFDLQPEPSAPCVHVLLDDVDLLLSRLELMKQAPTATNSSPQQILSKSPATTHKPDGEPQGSASKRKNVDSHPAVFECSTTSASESDSNDDDDDDSVESKISKNDEKSKESSPSKAGLPSDHSLNSALNTELSSASGSSLSTSVTSSREGRTSSQPRLKPPDVPPNSLESKDVRKTRVPAQKGGSSSNSGGSPDSSVKSKTSSSSHDLTIVSPDLDVTLTSLENTLPKAHSKLQRTEPLTIKSECLKLKTDKEEQKIEKTEKHIKEEKNLSNPRSVCKTNAESVTSKGDIQLLSGKPKAEKIKEIVPRVTEVKENGADLTKHKDTLDRAQRQGSNTLQTNFIRNTDNECHQRVDHLVRMSVADSSCRPLISGSSSATGSCIGKESQHSSKAVLAQLPVRHTDNVSREYKSGEYLKDESPYSKTCSGDGKERGDIDVLQRLASIRCDKTGSQPSRYSADFEARQRERKLEEKENNAVSGELRTFEPKSKILADSLLTAEELFQRIQRIKRMSQELELDKPDETPAEIEFCHEKMLVMDTVKDTLPVTSSLSNSIESSNAITIISRPYTQALIVQNVSKVGEQYARSRPLEELSMAGQYFTEEQMIDRTKVLGMYALQYLDHIENKIDAAQSSVSASEGDLFRPEGQPQEQKKLEGKPQTLCKKAFRQCSEPRLGTPEIKGKSRLHSLLSISPCVSDDRFTTDSGASGEKMRPKLLRMRAAGRRSASLHSWASRASSGGSSSLSKGQDLPSSREPSLIGTFRDIITLLGALKNSDRRSFSPPRTKKALVAGQPRQITIEKERKLVKFAPSCLPGEGKAASCNSTRPPRGQALVRKTTSSTASLSSSAAGSADNDLTITQAFDQLDKVVDDLLTLISPEERSLQSELG